MLSCASTRLSATSACNPTFACAGGCERGCLLSVAGASQFSAAGPCRLSHSKLRATRPVYTLYMPMSTHIRFQISTGGALSSSSSVA